VGKEEQAVMRIVWLLVYCILCGILLTLYSNIHDMSKFIFSLGAIYAGIRFFRRYESKGMRIWFIVLSVILYLVFNLAVALYKGMGNM
jgi:hypothetical protein